MKYFLSVDHKFLTSGHRFLPCHRDYTLIEINNKMTTIYHPRHWIDVITITQTLHPFLICSIKSNDFKNLTLIESSLKKDSSFKINEVLWFQITKHDPTTIRARVSHNIL